MSESWSERLEYGQQGVHFVPIGGIAGQSDPGPQSLLLSDGYVDDGEWFLYTQRY